MANNLICDNSHCEFAKYALNVSLICFNDISSAINVPINDQIHFTSLIFQHLILHTAAHARFS